MQIYSLRHKWQQLADKKRALTILLLLAIVLLVIFAVAQVIKPERSIAAYCKVHQEEETKLAKAYGDTYGVGAFSHKSSNPRDFIEAFSQLEKVAPKEILTDVKTMRQLFERIEEDPTQAYNAAIIGQRVDENITAKTRQWCQE